MLYTSKSLQIKQHASGQHTLGVITDRQNEEEVQPLHCERMLLFCLLQSVQ